MDAEQKALAETARFISKVNEVVFFPLIALLLAVAFLIFLLGCAEYIINGGNAKAREQGIKHITYGLIGLVVMMTAWAILELATATFGLKDELNCANDQTQSGCANSFTLPTLP